MIPITTIESCDSTMNVAAKNFALSSSTTLPFAIRAVTQTKSRGTGGRKWISSPGNLHLTIALPIPFSKILSSHSFMQLSPKTQCLFPCILGIALYNALNKVVGFNHQSSSSSTSSSSSVHPLSSSPLVLKWPNDVLIRKTGQKICGNLIETAYNTDLKQQALIVGIGVNVLSSVIVEDGGRNPGTLKDVVAVESSSSSSSSSSLSAELVGEVICQELYSSISHCLEEVVMKSSGGDRAIVEEFGKRLDWNTTIYLRKKMPNEDCKTKENDGDDEIVRTERDDEPFKPVRLNDFGGLVVKSERNGREVELSSDYLF